MNIMRKNHLKFTQKKGDKFGVISNVIKKHNENVTRKKPTKAHKQWQLNQVGKKQQLFTRGIEKICKQKVVENSSKLFLSGKFDFDPEEILDKSLLFNLKKNKRR